ncbi:MAG: DNA-directed RNA polymerase subunit K [Candidatus Methanoperedens sp.]|nr:DNA-directed RNA polymerase subunit K [Candidatus Methanoperedens sp.]
MTGIKYTRYERARIIGARALQISMGAPVLIEVDKKEPIEIAYMELEMGVIPITVKRTVLEKQRKSE